VTIHEVFSPTQEEIEEAQIILHEAEEAEKKGLGVFSYKGKMVDLPVIKRAEQIVDSARKWGLVR
jgi:citrate lyase subunit beta/citryl-CoA lyase